MCLKREIYLCLKVWTQWKSDRQEYLGLLQPGDVSVSEDITFFYEQRLIYINMSTSYSISELLSLFETLDFKKNKEYI